MSYVTGSHTFKAGALFINMAAHTTRESTGNGTALQLLDGVPQLGRRLRDAASRSTRS